MASVVIAIISSHGDDDLAANGTIVDQGGPGVPGTPATPTHDVPVSLQTNLALCAAAYSDATRIARAPANAEGDELRSKTAAKYAEIGFFRPDALGKVLAVARAARDNAAVEIGAKRRDWATLRTV